MEFKIGERVRFLHENMEGIVQEILGPRKMLVLVDDLLEEEVSIDDVVRIHRGERTLEKEEEVKDIPEFTSSVAKKQPLAAAITQNANGEYEIWLLNPQPIELHYTAFARIRKRAQPLNAGRIGGRMEEFVGKLSSDEFHHCKTLLFQILKFSNHKEFNPQPPLEKELGIRTEVFQHKPQAIEILGREGYFFPLEASEVPEESAAKPAETPKKEKPKPPKEVVDLHIQKLVKSFSGLDGDAMLRIQLEHFEQELNQAILHKLPKIIFIHGIGSGRLRDEIKQILTENQFIKDWGPADQVEYGNGATEVILA